MIEPIGFLQWVAGVGGIGAVFAVLMFYILMKVMRVMRDDRRFTEDRMTNLLNDYQRTTSENTKILSELYTYLRLKNGNKT